jgi:hypothetical protein
MKNFFCIYRKQQTVSVKSNSKEIQVSRNFTLSWSHVLIDLKIGELKHQDIGLILCQDKSEAVVHYTLPENNEQIFASKYQTVLPSREKLIELIENQDKIETPTR